jgi:serine/threonine protein phosphatase PrpC
MKTESPSCLIQIEAAGLSHAGNVRPTNEDHFAIMTIQKSVRLRATNLQDTAVLEGMCGPEVHIFVVADGIGGTAEGKLASEVAVRSVIEYLAEAVNCVQVFDFEREQTFLDTLSTAVWRGHERLKEMFPARGGAATTLTMVTLVWPRAYVVHAGDSRGYFMRNGVLRQFTRDQTMGDDLVDRGAVTEQQARKAGWYNVLSSEVGGSLAPSVGVIDLDEGDTLLLCTDGLSKYVPEERIARFLAGGSAESAAQSLIDAALKAGGWDNVTAVVARAAGVP